ncbi:uncharacterized protein I303_100151 [Kwoniella dejecticola CBS 10117]|uniref:Uncharacterized protein n=1 Tax=Kwoniella dejecticola CBS 10117 TaxID=1296121 RepID=A0A1A6AE48_9TREE|nr:uncharacterized protein I303_00151 [Kwoniella dejecticola CBS 10117]OBR88340.1 hypothetical protein I303_00151 [Kwoniella dejecticola CBS 10117]
MSYFSDCSSTCSAPPLTPSPYHRTGDSEIREYAYSTPTPYDASSPPASLRNYSSALVRKMSAGLTAAMKDLRDDRGGPERKFDVEYGYDEDPIERHVRLFLTPRKVPNQTTTSKGLPELGLRPAPALVPSSVPLPQPSKAKPHSRSAGLSQSDRSSRIMVPASEPRLQSESNSMLEQASPMAIDEERYSISTAKAEEDAESLHAKFRPGLIHFHRSNSTYSSSSSSSSLNPPRPAYSRMSTTMSNASTVSLMSEASFEAVRAEDIVSMYGAFTSTSTSNQKEDPFEFDFGNSDGKQGEDEDELEVGLGRTSMISTDTMDTIRPTQYSQIQPQLELPLPSSEDSNHHPQPSPEPALTYAPSSQRPPTLPSRPSLFRKRSRLHPYEAPMPLGNSSGSNTPNNEYDEPPWLANRTISEQMVAQAGLRCQRQRAGVNRR